MRRRPEPRGPICRQQGVATPLRPGRSSIVRLGLVAGMLTIVFAACSGATPPSPRPGPADISGLDGRVFMSTKVFVGGSEVALVMGTRIRISFDERQIGASAGCNSFGAQYAIVDGVLNASGGAMTEMGCDQGRHAQDDWLFGILGARPSVTVEGDALTITVGDTIITLLDREIAVPDVALPGTVWTLQSIVSGGTVSSVPDGIAATFEIADDGRVSGNAGCNQVSGTGTTTADTLRISDLATTKMACQGSRGRIEAAVLEILRADEITWSIDANVLSLRVGDIGLDFTGT